MIHNFQGMFLGIPKVIHVVKIHHVIYFPCQKPSTSSKYPPQGQEVLDTLLIMLEWWHFTNRSSIKCWEQLWGQGWPMSSVSLVRNPQCQKSHWWWQGGSWHTYNHGKMLKCGTEVMNLMSRTYLRSMMIHVLHVSSQKPSMSSK